MIEEIEAREKAATPELVLSLDGRWVWEMDGEDIKGVVGKFSRKEDAAAFFNARKGIPYPLAELKEAREKLGAVEARFGPPIVCLCGSTRFMDAFNEVGWQKTLDGEIVLSVGVSKYLPDDHGGEWCGEDVAQALDELHKRKIDLADYVFVLNVDGYIGESTRSEIEYAEAQGKRVDYLDRILKGGE